MKLQQRRDDDTGHEDFLFWCPGCKSHHKFTTKWSTQKRLRHKADWGGSEPPTWSFNRNMHEPTFSPSLLYFKDDPTMRCHLFLEKGKIKFLSDCFHDLKGQTVDMVDIPHGG